MAYHLNGRRCKPCKKLYDKEKYQQNRKNKLTLSKKYYINNKESKIAYQMQYYRLNKNRILSNISNNREKFNKYRKNKVETDINFKLSIRLRQRINDALNNNVKVGSAVKDLGCTLGELRIYLESKFQPGMNWDNYGYYGWHIDHIIPLSNFDLTDRSEFLKACHYTNLQPMWMEDNLVKHKKIPTWEVG